MISLPLSSRYSTRSVSTCDRFAFDVVLGGRLGDTGRQSEVGRWVAVDHGFIVAGFGRDGVFAFIVRRRYIVGRRDGVVFARFVNLHRFAIEIGVGKMVGGFAEVDQGEVVLLGVFMYPRAAPDDLLELGHGADFAVEHDQAAGLRIHAGGEQPRGGDDNRVFGFGVDEVAKLRFAFGDRRQ